MDIKVELDNVYAPSEDLVAREVSGEFIIVPITSGVGDLEDEIFTLNDTGRAIWDKSDGKRSLKEIVLELSDDFAGPIEQIERDVLGLTGELLERKIFVEVKK